jgi:D-alanine-D-alanine ligase
MRIGLTYDLRSEYMAAGWNEEDTIEFDSDNTISTLKQTLQVLGHQVERLGHILQLVPQLAAGQRWDLIFNIAEGCYGKARESQVPALLDAYRIPYTFSDPLVLAVCLDKSLSKRMVRDHQIATAPFAVVESTMELPNVNLAFPLFLKPVAEGSSKGIYGRSRVNDREQLNRVCEFLLARFQQPVLIESYLPGREFTVGILGTGTAAEAIGAMEVVLTAQAEPDVYSYDNKAHYLERVEYRLANDDTAQAAMNVALAAWRALGCRDGGRVDIRLDTMGQANFLEVNPLPGLHPERSDLVILAQLAGINYLELIGKIVSSAQKRLRRV